MNIVMIVVVIGGFLLLWPHLQTAIGGLGAAAAPVQTDTSGGGKAKAKVGGGGDGGMNNIGGMADADEIRDRTRKMIEDITRRAKRGGSIGGRGGIRQRNYGSGGTNISVSGKGAIACANGKCVSGLAISNVV